ncbi:MAG: hypothetical protein QNJ57_03485, partial [Flavobacteriaceae bacterium]|nr:hypothetical protein [Flavobacteriaceae bacterium]
MKKIIFDIYHYFKNRRKLSSDPEKLFNELNKSQYWSREEMEKHQLDKLNQLLSFSKKNSEFYSNHYKTLSLPFTSLEDFVRKTDCVTKEMIVNRSDEFKTPTFSNNFKHTTSGSSGDPLSVNIASNAEAYRKAGRRRLNSWWGVNQYDKSVLIWRFDNYQGNNPLQKFKDYFKQRYCVNVFSLNDRTIFEHYRKIEKIRPVYIRGYSSGVIEFAKLLKSNNLKFEKAKFKVVITTSENLFDHDRKLIEEVLNCKVANEYGSAEAGLFAYECPEGSMHLFEEANYIYNDTNLNAYVTEMYNDAMPLINYKNEDKIKITNVPCKCGRTLRVIEELQGRESGYIYRVDGGKVNQGMLIDIFIGLQEAGFENAVKKFKVIQRQKKLDVDIVPMENFNQK